ncbi:unnamed protein product [Prunus armeniaca]
MNREEEIPAEVIVESIALAQKQQETPRAELTSSYPEAEVEVAVVAPELVAEVPRTAGVLAVMTSPLKPPIVAISVTACPAGRLKKLSSTPGNTKSKAVDEAMERVKIWQSTELELDENREAVDQLMKDLDLLHRQNMAPKPILEMSLGSAREVLNLHYRYEDLKPTFKTSEFYRATHKANLADYAKQKAELDQMVAWYKEAKATADKLEKQIEELQKQLAECREVQNRLGARLSSKTKATFLVQSMVSPSRPALEIAEASIHQGMLLQKEISIKKTGL